MGVVYRARDRVLGRDVAMKVLPEHGWVKADARQRFENEARAAAALEHPNIVRVFDVGTLPPQAGSLPFYTMELLSGEDMRQAIKDGHLTAHDAVEVTQQIALALSYAHHHGILHRDVKPHNIHLRRAEPQAPGEQPSTAPAGGGLQALLLDFGLAKLVEGGGETKEGASFGTPEYMPPEQVVNAKSVDARADVYSLGAALYHALTGRPPFEGDERQVMYAVMQEEPVRPRRVNPKIDLDLETICLKAIAKDAKNRYQTAAEFAEDCRRYLDGEPIAARPIGRFRRLARRIRRHPLLSSAIAAIFILAVGLSWRLAGPAEIRVPTDPPGAKIETIGRTLWRGRWVWPPGHVKVQVSADGFESHTFEMDAIAGTLTPAQPVRLERLTGTLSVESEPTGAEALLDGKRLPGVTPLKNVEVPKGEHVLTLRAPEYEDYNRSITIRGGASTPLEKLPMKHKVGKLVLTAAPGGMSVAARRLDGTGDVVNLSPPVSYPLNTGRYELRGSATGYADQTVQVDVREGLETYAFISLWPQILWSYRTRELVGDAPALADLNGDGVLDAVFETDSHTIEAISGSDGTALWAQETGALVWYTPALCDLDLDGTLDCICISGDGRVLAFSGRDGRVLWKHDLGGFGRGAPAIALVDRDAVPEVLVATVINKTAVPGGDRQRGANAVYALSGENGDVIWTRETGAEVRGGPVVGVLNSTGKPACFIEQSDGEVLALEAKNGNRIWSRHVGGDMQSSPLLADVNRDGVLDCVVASNGLGVFALSGQDGSDLWCHKQAGKHQLGSGVADFNGDGIADCLVHSEDSTLRALSGKDGNALWSAPTDEFAAGSFALGDMNGDGTPDCVASAGGKSADGSPEARLCAFSGRTGELLWSRSAAARSADSPALGDLNGDGVLDCVVGVSGPGEHDDRVCAFSGDGVSVVWARNPGVGPMSAPALADLNGDGVSDFLMGIVKTPVIGTDKSVYALSGKDGTILWHQATEGVVEPAPEIGDLNRDGVLDAVVGSEDGRVYALSGKDGAILWKTERTGGPVGTLSQLGDLDRDGVLDVVAKSDGGSLYAVSGRDGSFLWRKKCPSKLTLAGPRLADLDGDGRPECVVESDDGTLQALGGGDGSVLWTYMTMPNPTASPAFADFDGDSSLDCLVAAPEGFIIALRGRDGRELWSWCPREEFMSGWSTPALADLNGDGVLDCVVDDCMVYALSGKDGTELWSHEIGGFGGTSAALADLNADGVPDCLVAGSCRVHALSGRDGHELWSLATAGGTLIAPVAGDIDGDEIPECVVPSLDGFVHVLRPPLRGKPCFVDPTSWLHRWRRAHFWQRLQQEASRIAEEASTPSWTRAVAFVHLGIARLSQADAQGALDAFAQARALRLRAADAAVSEWVASWCWSACPAVRREEAQRALAAALNSQPEAVFDAFCELQSAWPPEANADLQGLIEQAVPADDPQIARAMLLALLPRNDSSSKMFASARSSIASKLLHAQGNVARWFGYLTYLAYAEGDADQYHALYATYLDQKRRPVPLDEMLRGLRELEVGADSTSPRVWQESMVKLVQSGDYTTLRQVCEVWTEQIASLGSGLRPVLKDMHYNLACAYSLLSIGREGPNTEPKGVSHEDAAKYRERAFQHLTKAVEFGWSDQAHIIGDSDLLPLHDDPRWNQLLKLLSK